jgi:pyruvate formate lyase activating enzyme
MGECKHCGARRTTISDTIGFCADCIRANFDELWPQVKLVHDESRILYGLTPDPPRADNGIRCAQCFHECQIPEGASGYCGLRRVENGRLRGGRPHEGNLSFYFDPLPTNCVADFVCPGGTSCGYPEYSVTQGPEYGYKNLAVFYRACSFNCLYCQNYQFKFYTEAEDVVSAEQLASAVDTETSCICYFGGDPSPQITHAIKTSSIAVNKLDRQLIRICWETNGAMRRPFVKRMAELSIKSGGCIKFDIKAWDNRIHQVLCGVPNEQTLDNFKFLAQFVSYRPDPPFLVASTLLVPGYIDEAEVAAIASFIAKLNPNIPYRLLAFHPKFQLRDLPRTSQRHASACKEAAEQAGLRRVSIGNAPLLGDQY